ncbi:hypothetical protein [Roseofilum sp. Guam]|uniref:hypothetical protein n=1 Tax=Roseofilum sp. Guam TaxID=2821502 RepID=UPI001B045181|nr:hypothetical protein [Roseofilum sp. Guam]MBP0031195.1 hypothetical protein [Roseofilum sp. Guam]
MNAYQEKLQTSLLGKPQSKYWLFAYYAIVVDHYSLAQARSGAIRALIAHWHEIVPLSSPQRKLWEIIQGMRRELLEKGHLIVGKEKWLWKKGEFMPRAVTLKPKQLSRKMFRF